MDDTKIKYIDQALWLKTIEHYPKTVGHMKLLISIVDKMGIFTAFDLVRTSEMDSTKLNILYAILRITNKIYTKYVDHVVTKILVPQFGEIFSGHFYISSCYEQLFFDQLVQDIDHFVCLTTLTYYPNMVGSIIKNKLVEHIKCTLQKAFYKNVMKKIFYHMGNEFYSKYDNIFTKMATDYVDYSEKTLKGPYTTMKTFLETIFNQNCTHTKTVSEIINSLEKHINLPSLFNENCMEIDIYCEQKLDDEYEQNDEQTTNIFLDNNKVNNLNTIIGNIGYQIYNFTENDNILKPFVDHKIVNSEHELITILSLVLVKYNTDLKLMDSTNHIMLKDYYTFVMSTEYTKFSSYEKFCHNITNKNKLPKKYPAEMLLKIFSRIFDTKIKFVENDLCIIEIDNRECFDNARTMAIYCEDKNIYHTVHNLEEEFVPIGKNILKSKYISKSANQKPRPNYELLN